MLNEDIFNFCFQCGFSKPTVQVSLKDKEDIIRSVWTHYIFFRVYAELVQLKKGLDETLKFGLITCAYPQEVWSLFAASTLFVVTPEYLCDSFVVEYSDNSSNICTKEER